MKIGVIDVDGHHFPNLALMRLPAWHKAQGDAVELLRTRHKNGESYYWILYYAFLSP